ncbi:MAG: GNAT family N-acetyltransferase [Bacteroidales bacterium]|nr:GNAT family N-acetyltransferase [Bacteroidales bacterium]MBN2819010.1 GNAT family N-acetyltransferase [Bacteroidales bacterium]
MKIEHIAIWCKNLEKMKNFYTQHLYGKANNLYRNSKNFSSYFISFDSGCRIELMQQDSVSTESYPEHTGYTHIALEVGTKQDVDKLTIKLRNEGFVVVSESRNTGDGYYESVILDAEGNRVELTATVEPRTEIATESDLDEILFLQKCSYISEVEIYNYYPIPPMKETFEEIKEAFRKKTFLKLCLNGKIIGSVRAYTDNETCYIGRLIVDRNQQGKGYGKKLLQAIEEKFNQVKRYELFTGAKSKRNLSLYTNAGYKAFKTEMQDIIEIVYLEKIV